MLTVDLGLLERRGRITIDEDVSPDDPLWEGTEIRFHGPLAVRVQAQWAGSDVLVRGRIRGEVVLDCRRCLEPVRVEVEEPVTFLFCGDTAPEEEADEACYPLPAGARELELAGPVREHVLLAVPTYAICRDACRGLCPQCGVNLNRQECRCEPSGPDERWAALRKLKQD